MATTTAYHHRTSVSGGRSARATWRTRRILAIASFATAVFLAVPAPPATADDFAAGLAAFEAGQYEEAYKALYPFAERGNAKSQFIVAEILDSRAGVLSRFLLGTGAGIPKNDGAAARWYGKAAAQNHMVAQYRYGELFLEGRGVPQNEREASRWIRASAEQGYAPAMAHLATLYATQTGVARNDVDAYAWWSVAHSLTESAWGRELLESQLSQVRRRMSGSQLVAAREKSLVLARRIRDGGELVGHGSGFVVDAKSGVIVTSFHVIDGCRSMKVTGAGIPHGNPVRAKVVDIDPQNDLALVEIGSNVVAGAAWLSRSQRAALAEKVTAVGFPFGPESGLNFAEGNVSGESGPEGQRNIFQFTSPAQPGNSGGALLDAGGSVVGVIVGKYFDPRTENVGFAVQVAPVRSLLDINGVDHVLSASEAVLSPSRIAEESRRFAVLVQCLR